MDKKISYIKERALYLADIKELKKVEFCKKIGVTPGNFRGDAKKTSLSSDTIEKILSLFTDVNLEWLIAGIGEPFKNMEEKQSFSKVEEENYKLKETIHNLSVTLKNLTSKE